VSEVLLGGFAPSRQKQADLRAEPSAIFFGCCKIVHFYTCIQLKFCLKSFKIFYDSQVKMEESVPSRKSGVVSKGATGGAKGAEAPPPLARSMLRKRLVLIFSQFCAYNPVKLLLQQYHTLPDI